MNSIAIGKSLHGFLDSTSFVFLLFFGLAPLAPAQTTWGSSLDLSQMDQRRGEPRADRSAENHPLMLAGQVFTNGVGTGAPSKLKLRFWAGKDFSATVGVDDEAGKGNGRVVFKVLGDADTLLWQKPANARRRRAAASRSQHQRLERAHTADGG